MASIFNAFAVTIFACSYDLRKNLAYNEFLSQTRPADVFILGKWFLVCFLNLKLKNPITLLLMGHKLWSKLKLSFFGFLKESHRWNSEYQYDWGFNLSITASVLYFVIGIICLWLIFNLDEIYIRQKDDFKKEDPKNTEQDYELNRDIPAYLVNPRDREARLRSRITWCLILTRI